MNIFNMDLRFKQIKIHEMVAIIKDICCIKKLMIVICMCFSHVVTGSSVWLNWYTLRVKFGFGILDILKNY